MKVKQHIEQQLNEAQKALRCATASCHTDQMAFLRCTHSGLVISPYRGMFADASYWQSLNPTAQILHIARTLSVKLPSLVFAGPTAAAIHGFEHQWAIHHGGLYAADTEHGLKNRSRGELHRVYMSNIPIAHVDGVLVTSATRTVVDCGLMLPFRNALPIVNSALAASATTREEVQLLCDRMQRDCSSVTRLLLNANPLCENGGESMMYATIVEAGIAEPVVQHTFVNPNDTTEWYRVDFAWFLPGGRVVVAEYDGMTKYVDPAMTHRKSIEAVVTAQSHRERSLLTWAVNAIVRITYDDVVRRYPMINKLIAEGIPQRS